MTIYERQMKKLGLTIEQYAELTGIPIVLLKKLLKNEGVSENMGLNDFFRKNTMDLHEKLESDIDNTILKSNEIIIRDKEEQLQDDNKIYEWYKNNYSRDNLLKITNLERTVAFERNYKITINGKRASRWFYNNIINQGGKDIAKDRIIEFARQLYDIMENGNLKKYRDYSYNSSEDYGGLSDNKKWFNDFDLRKFTIEHDIKSRQGCKELDMPLSSYQSMVNKDYSPSEKVIKKVRLWVEKYQNNQEIVENEIIDETNNNNNQEKIFIGNNDEILKELLKERLTEKEKYLIRLFGGRID